MDPPSWDEPPVGGDQASVAAAADRPQVRQAVVEAVRSRPDMAADPELLDGYLRDVCPHQPAEVAVVVAAARAGMAEELATASGGHHSQATAARLAKRLTSEAGIDQTLARWAIDTWAVAVGAPASLPPAQPAAPAPPPPAQPPATLPPTLGPRPTGTSPEAEPAEVPAPAGTGRDAEVLHAMIVQPPPAAAPAPEAPKARAPDPPPPAPVPASVEPLGRTVQRPARPAPPPREVPDEPTSRRRRMALVAGSVAASALAIGLVAGLAGRGSEEPRTSPTTVETSASSPPVTTATSSTLATTTTVTAAPRPFPAGTTPVTPGLYATSTFEPRLTATLHDGWKVHIETSDYFELGRADSDSDFLSFLKPERVLRASVAFTTGAAVRGSGASEPAPADVVPWLRSHTRLRVSNSAPVTKAGSQGVQLDVVVTNGYESELCVAACLPLFSLADGRVFTLLVGHTNRVYVLTVGGDQVVVVTEARNDRFGAVVQQADRLVDTVAFKG